jgi:hypothetical protein
MDTAIISAAAAVLGSLVGGMATIAATWVTQKSLSTREIIRTEVGKREALYGEFISECSKLVIDAFVHTLERPETLLPAYALLNRIRLAASDSVLAEAERLLDRIKDQYFSRNLSLEELRALDPRERLDFLKPFGDACRVELNSIRARM